MNIKDVNKALVIIVELRMRLDALTYDSPDYDNLEEELHELEDDFLEKYGDYLEDALIDIHDEYCPDTDVLLPIAYLAKKYIKKDNNFDVLDDGQGVWVELEDEFEHLEGHIVIIPSPLRIVLFTSKNEKKIVWRGRE
jgi:hypothetical protein